MVPLERLLVIVTTSTRKMFNFWSQWDSRATGSPLLGLEFFQMELVVIVITKVLLITRILLMSCIQITLNLQLHYIIGISLRLLKTWEDGSMPLQLIGLKNMPG